MVTLTSRAGREQAARWCMNAPAGTRIEFRDPRRSTAQNDLMWSLLTDVARQVPWHGVRLSAEDFKLIFMAGLNQELRMVPNMDGNGFVQLGRSSSQLSVREMADLIELILAFGARHGVVFFDSDQGAGEPNKLPGGSPLQITHQKAVA